MSLLVILTLIYIVILVLALAASLIAIWIFLSRIATHLGQVSALLTTVEEKTRQLEDPLQLLGTVSTNTAQKLNQTKETLARADAHLAAFAGRVR